MWQIMNELVVKNKKQNEIDSLSIDNIITHDKDVICNSFNDYFVKIGNDLANKIKQISNSSSFICLSNYNIENEFELNPILMLKKL